MRGVHYRVFTEKCNAFAFSRVTVDMDGACTGGLALCAQLFTWKLEIVLSAHKDKFVGKDSAGAAVLASAWACWLFTWCPWLTAMASSKYSERQSQGCRDYDAHFCPCDPSVLIHSTPKKGARQCVAASFISHRCRGPWVGAGEAR